MGGKQYTCPYCSKGIPFEMIRKAAKGELESDFNKMENRKKELSMQQSNWEKQFVIGSENKDSTKYYDVIVCIDSILGIESGWKVKCSEEGKKLYEEMKDTELVKVGVVGLRNKGKSWLLQKFLNKPLPKGTSIKTEGLSIKYPNEEDRRKKRNYILLDSAGSEVPLLDYEKNLKNLNKEEALNQLERIAKDKTLTELFLQRFIISSSDMLFIVVGVLTYPEQKLLNRIEKTLKSLNQKHFKKLFVIHNLESFVETEQVETYIDEYLNHSATFELKENSYITTGKEDVDRTKNNKYYVETFNKNDNEDSSLQVFHLIMANEFSKAGEYYNDFTIKFLNEQLNSFTNIKSFPVIENLKDAFIKFSEEAFENPISESEINISSDLTIQLKPEKKIVFKKCFIDEMGFSNFFGSGFEPNYWVYKDKDKINITFEASGKITGITPDCDMKDGNLIFSITGNKEIKTPLEDTNTKCYQNSIKQGKFNLNIKLPSNNELKIEKPDDPDFIKGTTDSGSGGIYTFTYQLTSKDKKKKVYD
jgi:hypothetical protein